MSNFMSNPHELIRRAQTYALERKCISIHSDDRNTEIFKHSNTFEVTLPETLRNVQSICLAEINLPTDIYAFSNVYQNTKFKFTVLPSDVKGNYGDMYNLLNSGKVFETIITQGTYSPLSFASEIGMQMNKVVTDFLYSYPASGSLGIKGSGKIGETLKADIEHIKNHTLDTPSYQWQHSPLGVDDDWHHIPSATTDEYTIPPHTYNADDYGSFIRLKAVFGSSTLYSGPIKVLQSDNDDTLNGVLSFSDKGSRLKADVSNIKYSGGDQLQGNYEYEYQWESGVSKHEGEETWSGTINWSDISGATYAEYDYNLGDKAEFIRLRTKVTYSPPNTTLDSQKKVLVFESGYVNIVVHQGYNNFQVRYNAISQQLYIGNTRDKFELLFGDQCLYNDICETGQPVMWTKSRNWGLPFNMGFEKRKYESEELVESQEGVSFSSNGGAGNHLWLVPDDTISPEGDGVSTCSYYFVSPFPIQIVPDHTIYMELEKYNTMDELLPYSPFSAELQKDANCVCMSGLNASMNLGSPAANKIIKSSCSNPAPSRVQVCSKCRMCATPYSNVGGRVNAAFAKIPYIVNSSSSITSNNRSVAVKGQIQNVSTFSTPLDTVSKLKVKFRYHDGRLVDFGKFSFDFTLAFGLLSDEISRTYDTRVPNEYYM